MRVESVQDFAKEFVVKNPNYASPILLVDLANSLGEELKTKVPDVFRFSRERIRQDFIIDLVFKLHNVEAAITLANSLQEKFPSIFKMKSCDC